VITTYSYDAANQLVAEESASGRITYTYDPNGNMTVRDNAGARTTYTWDAENRLIGADLATGGPVTMTYDAEGLRRRLETPTEDTRFVWDGQNVLLETDEQGATRASYTLAPRRYGDLLSQRRGSDSRFYLFDGLGSTDRLLDEDEAVTDSYTYEAFGTARASSGTTANPYRYAGRLGYQFDGATGLHYLRARHYASVVGRFLSVDPERDAADGYAYAANRPNVVVDPGGTHGFEAGQQFYSDLCGWILLIRKVKEREHDLGETNKAVCLAEELEAEVPATRYYPGDMWISEFKNPERACSGLTRQHGILWHHYHTFLDKTLFGWDGAAAGTPILDTLIGARELGVTIIHEQWHSHDYSLDCATDIVPMVEDKVEWNFTKLHGMRFEPPECCTRHDGRRMCILNRLERYAVCECRILPAMDAKHTPPCV
jgi:RHS repeat-associated protein